VFSERAFLQTSRTACLKCLNWGYANIYGLWTEIHITSVLTPDILYKELVKFGRLRNLDTYEQLRRRIDYMVFHFKTGDDEYHQYQMPMSEYVIYEQLEEAAYRSSGNDELLNNTYFDELPKDTSTPFDDVEQLPSTEQK